MVTITAPTSQSYSENQRECVCTMLGTVPSTCYSFTQPTFIEPHYTSGAGDPAVSKTDTDPAPNSYFLVGESDKKVDTILSVTECDKLLGGK